MKKSKSEQIKSWKSLAESKKDVDAIANVSYLSIPATDDAEDKNKSIHLKAGKLPSHYTTPLPGSDKSLFQALLKQQIRESAAIKENASFNLSSDNVGIVPKLNMALLRLSLGSALYTHLVREVAVDVPRGVIPIFQSYYGAQFDSDVRVKGGLDPYVNRYTEEFLADAPPNSAIVIADLPTGGAGPTYGSTGFVYDSNNNTLEISGTTYSVIYREADPISGENMQQNRFLIANTQNPTASTYNTLTTARLAALTDAPTSGLALSTIIENNVVLSRGIFRRFFGDEFTSLEGNFDSRSVNFRLSNIVYNVTKNVGRTTITPELIQDSQAYHGIDAMKEATVELVRSFNIEMDNRVLRALRDMVTIPDASPLDVNAVPNAAFMGTRARAISNKILSESNKIWETSKFTKGNVVVVSPTIAVALQTLGDIEFVKDTMKDLNTDYTDTPVVGTLKTSGTKVLVDAFSENRWPGFRGDYILTTFLNSDANGGGKEALTKVTFAPQEVQINKDFHGNNHLIATDRSALVANPFTSKGLVRFSEVQNAEQALIS